MVSAGNSDHSSSDSSYYSSSHQALRGHLYDGLSVEEFVQRVWGLSTDIIAKILSTRHILDDLCLCRYKRFYDDPTQYGLPRESYQALVDKLLECAKEAFGEEKDSFKSLEKEGPMQNMLAINSITVVTDPRTSVPLLDKQHGSGTCSYCSSTAFGEVCPSSLSTQDFGSLSGFTKDEAALMSEASLAMSVSSRHYVTGTHIDRSKVRLWYFDRTCIIRTASFDFIEAPQKLALVTYALNYPGCRYGFDRFLVPQNANSLMTNGRVKELIGADVFFPYFGEEMGTRFRIVGGLIHGSRRILGRGTTVYSVSKLFWDGNWQHNLAMKMSWPTTSRLREAMFLKELSASLPRWRAHIPQIIYEDTYTAEELDLPRSKLFSWIVPWNFEDRCLSVLVTPVYQHLWEVNNINEFKTAFIDCVTCHFHAYNTARVLHRDVSENNLMFQRSTSSVNGVLNDWDLAGIVNYNGVVDAESSSTGTLPFMAIELLHEDPPPHRYEHDLESFFYVLVWAALHFDINYKVRLPTQPIASQWQVSFSVASSAKRRFLYDERYVGFWSLEILEDFQGVWKDWILPLRHLFAQERLGEGVTFDAFMAILRREPAHEACTFSTQKVVSHIDLPKQL
ncbi:hypothetical protein D9615_002188 [Tricholomella constricta]|uniref:Fungal-type protein kinase domain-containing protein n=1 Tax=Tricholomella constricta TaxID=117010 RepID=A0A8H5HN15_9AGAR|nr:hypothetical protein D9615_002188 [Tricholomella constricta]